MIVLQSLLANFTGWALMSIVFENVVKKNTKQFVFIVTELSGGKYEVKSQALRVFPDGGTKVQLEKIWEVNSLKELREGDFTNTRQGKVFLDSQFWVNKKW